MFNEIKDFAAPELDVYARTSEVQLLRYYEPEPGIFIAESPKVIERALNAGYQPISFLVEHKDLEGEAQEILKQYPDVPVYTAEYELLVKLTGFALTRGMLCAMRRNSLPSVEEICRNASRIAVLENVVNPTNIGAIFRSAAALHMDAVLLTGGCSDPLYRRAARVSMGTVFQIPWTYFDKKTVWPQDGMQILQNLGFKTAAMALRDDSVGIDDKALRSEEKLAVILGTEGDGLASQTIADCDYTVKIPMSHGVDSLNVAGGYEVRNRFFKGCIAPKDISHVRQQGEPREKCLVFEGMMDYLSFLTLRMKNCPTMPNLDGQDYIILNSVSNVSKAIDALHGYERIHCLLDNDEAGRNAYLELAKEFSGHIRDFSDNYNGHKDLNDYLCGIRRELTVNPPPRTIVKPKKKGLGL